MRRKDRAMSREYGLSVIDRSAFATLSLNDPENPDIPYALPLSIVRIDEKLYFHSARGGHKYENLQNGQQVRIVFVDRVKVPDLYTDEELRELAAQGKHKDFVSKVFTTEYSSAIVTGTVKKVDPEEKPDEVRLAMCAICEKYTPDKMAYFEQALDFSLKRLAVFSITIDSISTKRKQFDAEGEEMKWQQTE
ncbi:MAG: pyridoxamine 5'-phosphate oxidase family protein [Eubacteriales bacterium]|nr:pyridoxamine 5'-phosphate oxidase family protein [Eubacteriales bacterium]